MTFELSQWFSAQKIAKRMKAAPKVETTVRDTFFPAPQTHESPIVPLSEISGIAGAVPLTARGAAAYPIDGDSLDNTYFEPAPVNISADITAVELNNLRLLSGTALEAWATRKQNSLRESVIKTAEVLCAQAKFDGKIDYPLFTAAGQFVRYKVAYSQDIIQHTVSAEDKWNHADVTLGRVMLMLNKAHTELLKAGFVSGKVITMAGAEAFAKLLELVDKASANSKAPVSIAEDGSIRIGKHVVQEMSEVWIDPETKNVRYKIPLKEIRMTTKGNTGLIYAALDDLDAQNKALPFFVKTVKEQNPSLQRMIGQSKPLPCVAPKGTLRATVIA